MKPYYEHNGITIFCGDSLNGLATLPDESVNCCMTSPPYWGLRDYGTALWEGGEAGCEHTGVARRCDKEGRADKQSTQKGSSSDKVSRECLKCGARRIDAQLGLEKTPEEYIARMVAVFREVRRVLRGDGTLWLNMGDSYASGDRSTYRSGASDNKGQQVQDDMPRPKTPPGLKAKDLCGIPWMLAFALRADGWWLRQDIIWSKPNPMPESVTDRCTKAHEYLFLLSKSARYYFDAEAIREPNTEGTIARLASGPVQGQAKNPKNSLCRNDARKDGYSVAAGRNKRSVWEIATQPFPDAHFATFPENLVKPCILAGCPAGGTVLDPFGGAMTTMLVAQKLHCKGIAIELNADYIEWE